jgi:hypothetical protein
MAGRCFVVPRAYTKRGVQFGQASQTHRLGTPGRASGPEAPEIFQYGVVVWPNAAMFGYRTALQSRSVADLAASFRDNNAAIGMKSLEGHDDVPVIGGSKLVLC